jgi:hypothetical protein
VNPALAKDLEIAAEYAAIGRALFEEDARRSLVEADGSSEVYFLQESGMGAIKIGITRDLARRVQEIGANTPHEITVLGSVHADLRLEKYLKLKFEHARIRGEWFHPIEELCVYVEETTKFEAAKPIRRCEPRKVIP